MLAMRLALVFSASSRDLLLNLGKKYAKNVMESLISAKNSLNSTVKIPKNNINSNYKGIL